MGWGIATVAVSHPAGLASQSALCWENVVPVKLREPRLDGFLTTIPHPIRIRATKRAVDSTQ